MDCMFFVFYISIFVMNYRYGLRYCHDVLVESSPWKRPMTAKSFSFFLSVFCSFLKSNLKFS